MSLKQWANDNPAVVAPVAVILLVVALGWIFWPGSDADSTGAYFYDPDTDQLFAAADDALPPIETPSGGAEGWRVRLYACGGCPSDLTGMTLDELETHDVSVGFFERYSEEVRRIIAEQEDAPDDDMEAAMAAERAQDQGLYIRPSGDETWRQSASTAAAEIFEARLDRLIEDCPGGALTQCRP